MDRHPLLIPSVAQRTMMDRIPQREFHTLSLEEQLFIVRCERSRLVEANKVKPTRAASSVPKSPAKTKGGTTSRRKKKEPIQSAQSKLTALASMLDKMTPEQKKAFADKLIAHAATMEKK